MEQERLGLTLDDVSALFDRPAGCEERCRDFAAPLIEKLGAAVCAVVLGPRRRPTVCCAMGAHGPVPLAPVNADAAALDSVYLGESLVIAANDPWPGGLPFGPESPFVPERGWTLVLPLDTPGASGFAAVYGIARAFDEAELRNLRALCRVFALSLAQAELGGQAERLAETAVADPLTETMNRSAFYDRLRSEWRRASRELTPMAAALVDVDYFARFDDVYGEPAGDDALRAVAETIAGAGLRSSDFVARYGGDVFAIVLPGSGEDGALALCDRIRSAVADRAIEHSGSPFGVLTVSIGVAANRPSARRVPAAMLYDADTALHRAKQAGRNRVAGKEEIRTSLSVQPRSLLPEPARPLIGRERELSELAALEGAVTTILGPAGCGKSALALEFARRVPELAAFVDLSHARATAVVPQVARALGIVAYSSGQLAAALRDRTMHEPLMIVLDGCDDALEGATAFVEAVHGIDGLRTVITSRTPLRLRGERVYAIEAHP